MSWTCFVVAWRGGCGAAVRVCAWGLGPERSARALGRVGVLAGALCGAVCWSGAASVLAQPQVSGLAKSAAAGAAGGAAPAGALKPGTPPPPVLAVPARGPSAAPSAPGVTQSLRDVKLSLTASGRIEALLVREGQRVSRGQVLLHLDRALEDLEVQRRRLLLEDRSRLAELTSREKTLTEQLAAVAPLLSSGAISRKQYEDEAMALNNVISERKALEVGKLREQVELQLAMESYERRHLRSPIAGVVTKILWREGESVSANEPVVQVVDVSRVRFMSTVAAALGGQLKLGQAVNIQLGLTDKGPTRQARIVFVSPVTDAASGLVEVMAEFDNQDGSVKPGVSGRMSW